MAEEPRQGCPPGRPEDKALGLSDIQLLRNARSGDAGAFHQLVDRHAPVLFRLAVSLVGQAADAEDVVQETLLGAFEGLAGFREQASVKTWLTRILVRQAARFHRHRRVRWTVGLDAKDGQEGPTDKALTTPAGNAAANARMDLAQMLAELSQEHREIIVLREIEGLSYDEISSVLSLPRGTVESRLFRARQTLRQQFGGESKDIAPAPAASPKTLETPSSKSDPGGKPGRNPKSEIPSAVPVRQE